MGKPKGKYCYFSGNISVKEYTCSNLDTNEYSCKIHPQEYLEMDEGDVLKCSACLKEKRDE